MRVYCEILANSTSFTTCLASLHLKRHNPHAFLCILSNVCISLIADACAILAFMSGEPSVNDSATDTERVGRAKQRIVRWSAALRAMGLDGLAGTFLDAVEPLGPLGAQILWVAQPTLGLVMPSDEIDGLARLLDEPDGFAWLRAEFTGSIGEDR
jgi:hypothetical protein